MSAPPLFRNRNAAAEKTVNPDATKDGDPGGRFFCTDRAVGATHPALGRLNFAFACLTYWFYKTYMTYRTYKTKVLIRRRAYLPRMKIELSDHALSASR